jgi:hypothetical protein
MTQAGHKKPLPDSSTFKQGSLSRLLLVSIAPQGGRDLSR